AVGSSGDDDRLSLKNLVTNGPIVTVVDTLHCSLDYDMADDQLVIETNWHAPHHHVYVVDPKKPQPQFWKEIVPEADDATIGGMSLAGGKIYLTMLQNASAKQRRRLLDRTEPGGVPRPGIWP